MPINPRLLRPLTAGFQALRVGLVAYWPLNEDASSGDVTAVDWTGRGNDLTSNNTVPSVTGKIGNAREFVAANSEFLSRASNTDLQFGNGNWSISLWVQPRATGNVTAMIAVGKDGGGGREANVNYSTNTGNNSNQFSAVVFDTTNQPALIVTEPADTSNANFVNLWFHVALVNNGGVVTLYRNGVSRASATRAGGVTFNASTAAFNIGRRSFTGAENHFTGYVDEVAKWTRALSAAEITRLYNNGNGIDLRR
jgi:hypothetical protein